MSNANCGAGRIKSTLTTTHGNDDDIEYISVEPSGMDDLAAWESALIRKAREVRERQIKNCMIIVRFDGLAWQLLEAKPTARITE